MASYGLTHNFNDDTDPDIGTKTIVYTQNIQHDKEGNVISTVKAGADESDKKEQAEKRKQKRHAIVKRNIFNHKGALKSCELIVNSKHIIKILSNVVKYYPSQPDLENVGLSFVHPFGVLYHHWEELEEYEEQNELDDDAARHLNFLLRVLENECKEDRDKVKRLTGTGQITFGTLWCIYKPGDLIYIPRENQLARFVDATYREDIMGNFYDLDMERANYDGKIGGREYINVEIRETGMEGGKMINNLRAYPIKFAKPEFQTNIVEYCISRGQRSKALRATAEDVHIRNYSGKAWGLRPPPREFYNKRADAYAGHLIDVTIQGRIVVDAKAFFEENFGYTPGIYTSEVVPDSGADSDSESDSVGALEVTGSRIRPHIKQFWPADDPMLLPRDIFGFAPGVKLWCKFDVDLIEESTWKEGTFDQLILPDAPKRVIKALASAHEWPKRGVGTRDSQMSKGKGLVVLLHGAPGTGKTMTAEIVAEHTKTILVVISSGELGTDVSTINRNLTTFLQHAAAWKAVVLIDEADVFVETRITTGANRLQQNSLVAIFLRHLEYFEGILFMTTNRDSDFDPAIKSRIHLSLKFSPPDIKTRRTLWTQALSVLQETEVGYDLQHALQLVENQDMNGREISNAIRTMRTLVRSEGGGKVTLEHFKTFLQIWDNFENVEEEGRGRIGRKLTIRSTYTDLDEIEPVLPVDGCSCPCACGKRQSGTTAWLR